MSAGPFVPHDFDVPLRLATSELVLGPLGSEHNLLWRAVSERPAADWPFARVQYASR